MHMTRRPLMGVPILAGILTTSGSMAFAADITGAGATFPYPIYAKWAEAYQKETGHSLRYQSLGSGAGIKMIQSKAVTFGASDMPLKGDQLAKDGLVQFPAVMGGVAMAVNVEGIGPGQLVLDGATIAQIYLGQIKSWNDPRIKNLNPTVNLPSQPITAIHRADGSGTTFVFTDFLSKVSDEFKSNVGSGTVVTWPTGTGTKGSEGIAGTVSQIKGAIGYAEFAYLKQNKLPYANMINRDGKTIAPELKSFQAAAANANWSSAPGFGIILTNEAGAETWPITGATFILMHRKTADAAGSREALKFFAWAYAKGGDMAVSLDYVPLPKNVIEAIKMEWGQIVDLDGKPVM